MRIQEIIDAIEEFAPLKYQESYDNSGLQVGDPTQEVKGVHICVDITEEVLDKAIEEGCNVVISHHPLLFHGVKKISPIDPTGRVLVKAIKHDITLYSSHTNMDSAPGGVSYRTAEKLGIRVEKPLVVNEKNERFGLGVVGILSEPEDAVFFLKRVKETLQLGVLRHTLIEEGKKVERVALCGGSAFEFYVDAIAEKADIYLTADVKYHQFFEPNGKLILADIGHYESEQYVKDIFYEIVNGLVSKNNAKFALHFSGYENNPVKYL